MRANKSLVFVVAIVMLVILACGNGGPQGAASPAQQLMPDIKGYDSAKTQSMQKYLADVAGGTAALSGRVEMAALIKGVDIISQCYQDNGAVDVRAYSNQQDPLVTGAIVIVDKKMIADPKLFLQCTVGSAGLKASEVQPCSYTYPLQTNEGEFQIAYVGTTTQICNDFCTSLKGCAASEK